MCVARSKGGDGGGVWFFVFFFLAAAGEGAGGVDEGVDEGEGDGMGWDGMGRRVILKILTVPPCYFHGSVGQKASWLRGNEARERTGESNGGGGL